MQIRKANVLSCAICPYLSSQTCVGSLMAFNRPLITSVLLIPFALETFRLTKDRQETSIVPIFQHTHV